MTTYIASTSGGEIDGSAGNDVMIGKSGDDTFDGGTGSDIILGGAGSDIIYYDEFDIKVDGGTGYDTLVFNGTGQTLNLGLQKTVMNFEKIELSGGGGHSLTFSAADVLRTSDLDSLLIRGTNSSTVNFADSGWIFQGYSGGQSRFANGGALVFIDSAVNVVGFSGNATLSLTSGSVTSVTEDLNPDSQNMLVAAGTILVSDPNAGQALLLATPTPIETPHGTLDLGANSISGLPDGSYAYKISNTAAQQLSANTSWTDKFIVTSVDGSTMTLEFKVNGVNDDPVRQGYDAQGGIITEITDKAPGENSTPHTVSGNFVIRDVDATDSLNYWIDSPDGHRGNLTVTSISVPATNGDRFVYWEYTVNDAALDTLSAQAYAENYTIYLSDRAKDTAGAAVVSIPVNLTLQGSNDAPILQPVSGITYHDTDGNDIFVDTVGNLIGSDVDEDDIMLYLPFNVIAYRDPEYSFQMPSNYGTLFLHVESGAYKFVANDKAIEALKTVRTVNFFVNTYDGIDNSETQAITFTFIGVNDAPIRINAASDVTSSSVTELASTDPNANSSSYVHEVSGSFTVQDVDPGDTLSLSGIVHTSTGTTQYGSLTIDSISSPDTSGIRTVNWSYSVTDQALDPLAVGTGPTQTFAISLTDGTATVVQNVTITLIGSADPIIGDNNANTLDGTAGADLISGLGGIDTINGFAGDDIIYGGSGDDIISGGGGNDTIFGGDGNDEIVGGAGINNINGDDGNDSFGIEYSGGAIHGGAGFDEFSFLSDWGQADGASLIVYGDAGGDNYYFRVNEVENKSFGINIADFDPSEDSIVFFISKFKTPQSFKATLSSPDTVTITYASGTATVDICSLTFVGASPGTVDSSWLSNMVTFS